MTDDTMLFRLISFPVPVGHWIIPGGGCHFSTYHRPNWFHRLANRVLLGWKWEAA